MFLRFIAPILKKDIFTNFIYLILVVTLFNRSNGSLSCKFSPIINPEKPLMISQARTDLESIEYTLPTNVSSSEISFYVRFSLLNKIENEIQVLQIISSEQNKSVSFFHLFIDSKTKNVVMNFINSKNERKSVKIPYSVFLNTNEFYYLGVSLDFNIGKGNLYFEKDLNQETIITNNYQLKNMSDEVINFKIDETKSKKIN